MANIYVTRGSDTIPTTGNTDSLYFLGGNASVVNGLDLTGIAGIVKLVVGGEFTGRIGAEGNPLKARVTSKISYGAAAGDFYFQPQGSGAATSAFISARQPMDPTRAT